MIRCVYATLTVPGQPVVTLREFSMQVDFQVYRVTDGRGNVATGVVNEGSDRVQVCGMIGQDGGPLYFEAEFYHLPQWCSEFGLTFWSQQSQIEIPSLPVQAGE